jgi:hypothetical protein
MHFLEVVDRNLVTKKFIMGKHTRADVSRRIYDREAITFASH